MMLDKSVLNIRILVCSRPSCRHNQGLTCYQPHFSFILDFLSQHDNQTCIRRRCEKKTSWIRNADKPLKHTRRITPFILDVIGSLFLKEALLFLELMLNKNATGD